MTAMQTAWILEDIPDAQHWLERAVQAAFPDIRVRLFARVSEALAALSGECPQLALVDLKLPDGNGLSLLEALRERCPNCLSIVTTVFDDDAHLFPALRAGAQGYVLKDQSREQLAEMLRGIVAGRPPLSPSIARRLLRHFQPLHPHTEPEVPLTPRETEVLQLIAKGLPTNRVSELLSISRHTAAGYVKDIYRKLAVSSRAEATLEAARRGLV